jgi:hypothetical protein
MKFGVSFSADKPSPLPQKVGDSLQALEGFLPSRTSLLDDTTWDLTWKNMRSAARVYGAENVSFHFPVYQCCYMTDAIILERLFETFARATDLGLAGVTVCSNQVQNIRQWQQCDLQSERTRLVETLTKVFESASGNTWLALENMPLFCDGGSSPLFCIPAEFSALYSSPVGITWDFANFVETLLATSGLHRIAGNSLPLMNLHGGQFLDFAVLKDSIVHWHFAAIEPARDPMCPSGREQKVSPNEGILPESIYRSALEAMINSENGGHIIFELTEKSPDKLLEMLSWAESVRAGAYTSSNTTENHKESVSFMF